jgi:transcriptional regulator with XRE-family HTH domain
MFSTDDIHRATEPPPISVPVGRVFSFDQIREWVLWARRQQMISGPDVAEFLGISPSRVNEIERGEKPGMLPATRRQISERIRSEMPQWQPAKQGFPPLEGQLSMSLEETPSEVEETERPKISGQLIAIEVDEDDLLEIVIQIKRRKIS